MTQAPPRTTERRFDVMADITKEWFQSYAAELAKYAGGKADAEYTIQLGNDFDNRIRFADQKEWLDQVLSNWEDVVETSIWQYGGIVQNSWCNLRRHDVRLKVSSDSTTVTKQTFESLGAALSLVASPEDPYRYRRSSLEFEIGNWRPDLFVEGIREIALSMGGNPALTEAYAKSFKGDIEELTPFLELKDFCDAVGRRASLFGEVVVGMQARSVGVGISVTSDHKKLRIRTSRPPLEVDSLIAAWPDGLQLKLTKAKDTGAELGGGPASTPSEKPLLKYGVPIVIAFLTAVSVAGLVGLKKAVWPDYVVVIEGPVVENGIARWKGSKVPIGWYLKPEAASLRQAQKDVAATVSVHGANGFELTQVTKPPLSLSLAPGAYVVMVDAPGAAPAQLQVLVEDPLARSEPSPSPK